MTQENRLENISYDTDQTEFDFMNEEEASPRKKRDTRTYTIMGALGSLALMAGGALYAFNAYHPKKEIPNNGNQGNLQTISEDVVGRIWNEKKDKQREKDGKFLRKNFPGLYGDKSSSNNEPTDYSDK